jgi:sugar-specific transcriptional regulator TrmB
MRACQMQEDLVKKLADFGFTVNQAKVYLDIVQSGLTCVSNISKFTQLHRQDIYKILPKLEKMGLITKTIDAPFMIEAIPVEKALNSLVSTERKKANERTSRLEADLKELINAIRKQQGIEKTQEEEEERFILLKTEAEVANMSHLTFENTKLEYDLVTNLELIAQMAQHLREHFQKMARRGVKMRIIVENLNNENLVKKTLEKIRPNRGDFAAQLIYKSNVVPYQIIDYKELLISEKEETELGLPCALWTNDKNMVQFFEESFKEAWNDPCAVSICSERDLANREFHRIKSWGTLN